jgi:hypothetical protein
MKLSFRPMLSETQLTRMQSRVHVSHHTREAFASYRKSALAVKAAGRTGDKEAYDKACRALEHDRERIDWCIGHRSTAH